MTAPEWLTMRDGGLVNGANGTILYVTLDGHPQWRLDVVTAKGRLTCAVMQTNNGQRLDGGRDYATQTAALAGGLEELRARLGW